MSKVKSWILYKTYISPLKCLLVMLSMLVSAMMTEQFDWYLSVAGIPEGWENHIMALAAWLLPVAGIWIVDGMAVSEEVTKRKYMTEMRFHSERHWKNYIRSKVCYTSFVLASTNLCVFTVYRFITYGDFLQDKIPVECLLIVVLYELHVVIIALIQSNILIYAKRTELGFLSIGMLYVFSMLIAQKIPESNPYLIMVWGMYTRNSICMKYGFWTWLVIVIEGGILVLEVLVFHDKKGSRE